MNLARCGSCGAWVIWANHVDTGKPAPLDYKEVRMDYGNIMLHEDTVTYQVLDPEVLEVARAKKARLYTNHLGTCPGQFRERKAS